MAFHGRPRYTGDLDIFVQATQDNGERLLRALTAFKAPAHGLTPTDVSQPGVTVTLGIPPRRIDILNWISGLTWDDANEDAVPGDLGGISVRYLSERAWRKNKSAANRESDREDLSGT